MLYDIFWKDKTVSWASANSEADMKVKGECNIST